MLAHNHFIKRLPTLYIPILSDLLFFFLYGFIARPVFDAELNLLQQGASVALQRSLEGASLTPLFTSPLMMQVCIILLLFGIAVFLLFSLFQGTAWWWAHNRPPYADFILAFAKQTLFWVPFYLLYELLSFFWQYKELSMPAPIFSAVLTIYLILLMYFAVISFARVSMHIKRAFFNMPAYFFPALIVFVAAVVINRIIVALPNPADIIIGILLFFPFLSWVRLYAIEVTS